jgi:Asp-tRNA(Asn)/Glu-tRNA(Gln) amidotransferase A subunit family amidase
MQARLPASEASLQRLRAPWKPKNMTPSVQSNAFLKAALLATIADELRNGALTLHDMVDAACDRIEAIEPIIQSLVPEVGRRERLHREANALLARYPAPGKRPPLFGMLVGIKDIFHVDGFVTRAGTTVPPETFAGTQARVAANLVDAGALILGKTVTTEFAYFEPGPTRNPHNPEHTPGGSSSGSAAAVAAGLCPLAVGTQTIGSVIRPAAFCGLVGFKPTLDRLPTQGVVYFSPTVDHTGLFTQDTAGMIVAASVLLAGWRSLPFALRSESPPVVAIPDGPYLAQGEPEALAAFEEQTLHLAVNGWQVQRIPMFADIAELNALHRRLAFAEFARGQAERYAQYAAHYRPRTAEIIHLGAVVTDEQLLSLREHCLQLRTDLTNIMDSEGIDAWITPAATGPAPAGIHATGDPNMNLPWTHAGMPAITVPAGRAANGLPLGMQLVARFDADEELLLWAAHAEAILAGQPA